METKPIKTDVLLEKLELIEMLEDSEELRKLVKADTYYDNRIDAYYYVATTIPRVSHIQERRYSKIYSQLSDKEKDFIRKVSSLVRKCQQQEFYGELADSDFLGVVGEDFVKKVIDFEYILWKKRGC